MQCLVTAGSLGGHQCVDPEVVAWQVEDWLEPQGWRLNITSFSLRPGVHREAVFHPAHGLADLHVVDEGDVKLFRRGGKSGPFLILDHWLHLGEEDDFPPALDYDAAIDLLDADFADAEGDALQDEIGIKGMSGGYDCWRDRWRRIKPEQRFDEEAIADWREHKQEEAPVEAKPDPTSLSIWPEPLDLVELAQREPQPPEFILQDWLPCGYATLLAGHGGVGKSGIALHLAVCIAAGLPFYGVSLDRRRVMYLSCEDRANLLHWRLSRTCRYTGIGLADLKGELRVLDLVGRDSILWERDPKTGNTVTPAFAHLADRIEAEEIELLVVDGISDTYAGQENNRTEVKRYVNALVSLIDPDRGAVLLVGHISKPAASTITTTEGYSGSTSWHNSVRARWYLYPETAESEESGRQERTGELLLELQKSNLGRTDQAMRFRWDEQTHLYVGETVGRSIFDRRHQEREEQRGILLALKGCIDAGITVPAALQGPRTGHFVLSQRPEFPDALKGRGRLKTARFRKHLEQLRQLRMVKDDEYRREDRHKGLKIVLTTEGLRECG